MINNLKTAIDEKDWSKVVEFYRMLAGTFESPVVEGTMPVKASGRLAESDFSMRRTVASQTPTKAQKAPEPPKTKRASKKKKAANTKIEFVDTGERVEEAGADLINDNVTPSPRTRKPFQTVSMACIVCKKTEDMHPLFKRDAEVYKCDRCLIKGKKDGVE
jgi:hypothetical protein